jgi:hypothetical protein
MKLKGSIVCLVAFTLSTPAIGHLHPAHGRFMQRDPLRYKESPSLYEYVRSGLPNCHEPSGKGLELVIDPPSEQGAPWTKWPLPDGVDGRTITRWSISCCCWAELGAWMMDCRAFVGQHILIDDDVPPGAFDPENSTIDGGYGHEQRHVKNGIAAAGSASEAVAGTAGGLFDSHEDCARAADEVMDGFNDAMRTHDEREGGHQSPEPRIATPYPPFGIPPPPGGFPPWYGL